MARTPSRNIRKKHADKSRSATLTPFERKEITMVFNHCYQRFRVIGDCTVRPMALGLKRMHTALTPEKRKLAYNALLQTLSKEQHWGIAVSCFFYHDKENEPLDGEFIPWGSKISVMEATAVAHDFTALDVGECLNGLLSETIHQCLNVHPSCHKDNFVYYGYAIIPDMDYKSVGLAGWLTDTLVRVADLNKTAYFGDNIPIVKCDNQLFQECILHAGTLPPESKCIREYLEISGHDYTFDDPEDESSFFLFNTDIVAKDALTA